MRPWKTYVRIQVALRVPPLMVVIARFMVVASFLNLRTAGRTVYWSLLVVIDDSNAFCGRGLRRARRGRRRAGWAVYGPSLGDTAGRARTGPFGSRPTRICGRDHDNQRDASSTILMNISIPAPGAAQARWGCIQNRVDAVQ